MKKYGIVLAAMFLLNVCASSAMAQLIPNVKGDPNIVKKNLDKDQVWEPKDPPKPRPKPAPKLPKGCELYGCSGHNDNLVNDGSKESGILVKALHDLTASGADVERTALVQVMTASAVSEETGLKVNGVNVKGDTLKLKVEVSTDVSLAEMSSRLSETLQMTVSAVSDPGDGSVEFALPLPKFWKKFDY